MKNSNLKTAWINFLTALEASKEEILLNRLEEKLGKSKDEVQGIISNGLLSLLTKVPFDRNYKNRNFRYDAPGLKEQDNFMWI
jgi:hypothetical protein